MQNEENREVWTYTIKLVSAAVNGYVPAENTEDLPWQSIVDYAGAHSVLNLVAYSAEHLKVPPPPYFAKLLKEMKMKSVLIEAAQQIETEEAMNKLEKLGIKHMALKGYNTKNAYPSPDMRTMSDIDILVEADKRGDAVRSFVDDGFKFCGEGDLHSNVRRGNIYFEFHGSMVDSEYENLTSYFGDGFSRAILCDGYNYRYKLKHEDEYIFMIAHLAKHYRYGGTGIRSVLDLYVYRKAYPNMDFEYISRELEKIGLKAFADRAESLADDWFLGNFDGNFDEFSSYIASGGVYGAEENKLTNAFILDNMQDSSLRKKKIDNLFTLLFPKREIMSIRYPVLKKYKFLLPIFYVVRFFETLFRAPKNAKNRMEESVEIFKISKEQIEAQKKSGIDKL